MGPVAEFCSEEAGSWKESWRTLSRFPPATSQFDLILGQNRSPIYRLDPPHVNLVDLCLPVILSYLRNSIVINVLDLKQSFNKASFEGVSSFAYTSTQTPTSGKSILLAQFQPHKVPKVSHPHALGGCVLAAEYQSAAPLCSSTTIKTHLGSDPSVSRILQG